MKIMIIGLPGTGKTTFVTSVYGHYSEARNGVSLHSSVNDINWSSMFQGICQGIYPDKTQKRTQYDMKLNFNCNELCDMSFIDYNGGVFDPCYEIKKDELAIFKKDMLTCDGILCLLESKNFTKYNEFLSMSLEMLSVCLLDINRTLPIGFVITKSDKRIFEFSILDYYSAVGTLLAMSKDSPYVYFGVFPVSCAKNMPSIEAPMNFLFLFNVRKEKFDEMKYIDTELWNIVARGSLNVLDVAVLGSKSKIGKYIKRAYNTKDKKIRLEDATAAFKNGLQEEFMAPPVRQIDIEKLYV